MSLSLNKQTPEFFINGILNGEIPLLSRAITLVESNNPEHQDLARKIINGILPHTGKSFRLGITGVPGVGKSTFIESFGKQIVSHGHQLAVLAIDPSSTKNKGSILGDKTRMEELSIHEKVFIRPSPSGGTLGGLTKSTYQAILLCEAAGFDFIIIETVGVGQSETAVSKLCDFFLLLMLAGAGDELQGIKRGIMELADALVITKADGTNLSKAKAARAEYAQAMHLLQPPESGWTAQVKTCSSTEKIGMEDIYTMIQSYETFVRTNNYFGQKRNQQQHQLFLQTIEEQLKEKFYADKTVQAQLQHLKSQSNIQPFLEVENILNEFFAKYKNNKP